MKTKYSYLMLIPVFCLLVFSSCEKVVGEGPVVTEIRDVSNFRSVSLSISGTITYKIDPVYRVEVRAQQNILDVLQTYKMGSELLIKFKDGVRVKDHEDISVIINAPYAEGISLSGSGEVTVTDPITSAYLKLKLSGSGNVNVPSVNIADLLTTEISGSGNIYVSGGTAKNASLKISGSGKIEMPAVATEKVDANISGSGDMHVKVSQNLDASISGSGSVFYRGNPIISTHISGSGKVVPF